MIFLFTILLFTMSAFALGAPFVLVDFEDAAAYNTFDLDGGVATVSDGGTNLLVNNGARTTLKMSSTNPQSSEVWGSVNLHTDTAVDAANGLFITAAVYSITGGNVDLEFGHFTDPLLTHTATHYGNGWETLSYDMRAFTDFATPAEMAEMHSIRFYLRPSHAIIYIDYIVQSDTVETKWVGGAGVGFCFTATADDNSCIYPVYGCTDPSANNYDSTTTTDDGSCTYTYRTCANIAGDNSNTAFDCSNAANDIDTHGDCPDGCTAILCCTVVPPVTGSYRTCADINADNSNTAFDCDTAANDIAAMPAGITCSSQTDGCTPTECCTAVPIPRTCADINADNSNTAFDCDTAANDIAAMPAGITCNTEPCTATLCCTVLVSVVSASDCDGLQIAYKENCNC